MTRDKKRTPETRTIFNNYYDSDKFEDARQFLFENYAEDHSWDMYDSDLHKRLWNDSHYTRLPHFAHKVYGCKKTAYVKAA